MLPIKFKMWDTERKEMFTSPQSIERGMRNLLGIPGKSGFSSVDVRPQPHKYIPLMCTGMPDKNGVLLWEGDCVEFKFDENDEFNIEGEIVYEPGNACFSVKFESFGESVLMPLLGLTPTIWSTGRNVYESVNALKLKKI